MSFSPVWMKISKISPNGWSLTNSHLIFYQNRVYTSRLHTWAPKPNPLFWPSMVLSKTRYQSILINANLTWGNHIDKLASGIAAIKRVRQFFPQQNCISITKPWFSRISTTAMSFVCGIKLADKLPKSCCAAPNFLKLWRRRFIAAYFRKVVVLNVTLKSLYWALTRAIMGQI